MFGLAVSVSQVTEMIKLYTLENLSAFTSDAIYKICLSLDNYGFTDDKVSSFDNYDSLFDAAETSLLSGDHVIIAAENSDYLDVKHMLASRFMLRENSMPVIAEAISKNNLSSGEVEDMEAHCTAASGSTIHLSYDGLYSGFSFEYSGGVCTLVPLDFDRLDDIIKSYASAYLERPVREEKPEDPLEKFVEPVSKMVDALRESGKTIAIATGETTLNIYNLYDKIDGLSSVVNFVDVIDDEEEADENKTSEQTDDEKFVFDEIPDDEMTAEFSSLNSEEDSDEDFESEAGDETEAEDNENEPMDFDEVEAEDEKEELKNESVSARTVRHAREAMNSMNAQFGAAISELCEEQGEDGTVKYSVYVAVADEKATKTKLISTADKSETQMLLDYCVTILSQIVCVKAEAYINEKSEKKPETVLEMILEKILANKMIVFAAAVLLVSIIVPLVIVHMIYGGADVNQTTLPDIVTGVVNQVDLPVSQTTAAPVDQTTTAAPTTTNAFGIGGYTTASESAYSPVEPPATEVSAIPSTQLVSSTSGTFTFYVFGYGHGAGMSQTGANYLASQGWNYAQILANYYYGTTLVSGDTYPETIKYSGQEYKTRDFLAGVLEAEMGSSYLPEALKAQCVAAYTFAKYYAFDLDADKMAYEPTKSQTCYDAVDAIMNSGVYISYGGSTALTPFFATSAGKTTSYYNVWGQYDLPYLQGGRPSYGDYNAPNFKQVKTYSSADLKSLIESKDSSITLSGDPSTWISVITHDAAVDTNIGYISSINVGGKIMSGNDFRSKIMGGDLNSHCFMVSYTPDK